MNTAVASVEEAHMAPVVLAVEGLAIDLDIDGRRLTPVDGVSFTVGRGETLGIVGESGSGKSLTLRGVLGILPEGAGCRGTVSLPRATGGERPRVALIFQEPMLALNPTMRVGDFIGEAVRARGGTPRRAVRATVLRLMDDVGIPDPERRARMWPHELSGGLRQRVMIAAALAIEPDVLLCDEPTTALDVTVQAQILTLLKRLSRERGMGMVFVSHDLAVVGTVSDRIAVMYAGRLVEAGRADQVLRRPQHPYTVALLGCTPSAVRGDADLETIPGTPPDPGRFPVGCRFAPRCPFEIDACHSADYTLAEGREGLTACIRTDLILEARA